MTALRLGSLFDGIGVFPLAAVRCGIEPVWASEIEKAPISITTRHFPDMEHLGDVTKLDGREIPPVHITLFIIVLIVGLLMVLLPSKAIKNLVNQNGVLVVLRLLGIIMCVASSVTIYALVAGKIVLPLIK